MTKNGEGRTKLALKLSEDVVKLLNEVKLCLDVEKLCNQLRENLESISIPILP